jgi:hypothetical protein
MAPEQFMRFRRLARAMGHCGAGDERGLQRHFLSDTGQPERHRAFMALVTSANPSHAAAGRGYRDAIARRLPTRGE